MRGRRRRPKPPPTYQQCEDCGYDFATDEGARSCNYLECPYLPDVLDVKCPTCLFNFYTDDGNPACGDPPDCDFALHEAPARVAALRGWLETGQLPSGT
jgi:hypothetical protein